MVIRMSVDSDMFWCLREICSMRTFWVFSVAGFSSRTGTARNVWSIWSRRCPQQRWFAQRGRSKALSTNLNAKHGDLHQFQRQALAVVAELTKLAQTGIARSAEEPPNALHTCEQQCNFGWHRACISTSKILAFGQLEVTSIKLQLIQVF